MKKYIFLLFISLLSIQAFSQNKIGVRAGIASTNTLVSEYGRGMGYFYYDSITLDTRVLFPAVNVDIDIDLGKRWYLTTGLSYMRKGIESVYYNNGDYAYEARQEYMGMNILLKYHYKFNNGRFGLFAAGGMRADFTVGGPNNAEITTSAGAEYFHAFGTFEPVEFLLPTMFGVSLQLGPGEMTLDVNFLNGLTDIIPDRFIVARTFTMGASLGYSFYLQ